MARNKEFYINKYNMHKHKEGGYFSETYRSDIEFHPEGYEGIRPSMTSIYFLLSDGEDSFSSFHQIKSDEIWHFHDGCDLIIYIIAHDGSLTEKRLGRDDNDAELQIIIPKNHWFAAKLCDESDYAIVGCTVTPGFVYQDWVLANRDELINDYPDLSNTIKSLTRNT